MLERKENPRKETKLKKTKSMMLQHGSKKWRSKKGKKNEPKPKKKILSLEVGVMVFRMADHNLRKCFFLLFLSYLPTRKVVNCLESEFITLQQRAIRFDSYRILWNISTQIWLIALNDC